MSVMYHEESEEYESYEEESKMTIEGVNDDKSLDGSHHLIVEFIKAVTNLDENNMIITGFTGKIHFIRNHRVDVTEVTNLGESDGYSINIDTHELERLKNFQTVQNPDKQKMLMFIDSIATMEDGWMHTEKFYDFIRKLMPLLFNAWSKKIVMSVLDPAYDIVFDKNKDCDFGSYSYVDYNTLFDTLDIKYRIRRVSNRYKVDRV